MTEDSFLGGESHSEPFLLGDYEVDPGTHCIGKDGATTRLEPRSMALLLYLAHRPGTVVSREELEREVWKDVVVGYDALNNTVAKLRKAFDDDPRNPRVIHTVPKKGYQLIAEIRVSPSSVPATGVADFNPETHPSLERKLAAILYADVADYSRLTGLDEEGTHRSLSARLDLMTLLIERFHGSVVHFAGDAILAEFATVSNALACAVTLQAELGAQNSDVAEDRRLQFRIGVNLGEVIVDRNDIYGDGVNVAARLETLAEPGGVCLSGSVFDAIGNQLPLEYQYLGERQVKNIEKPVRAYYAQLIPGRKLEPPPAKLRTVPRSGRFGQSLRIAAIFLLVAAIVLSALFLQESGITEEADSMPLEGKPAIAVLPFENISGDKAQEFYADGMTRDLITGLSKFSGLTVIAYHSVIPYKDHPASLQQIRDELGVSHVVGGNVRRLEGRIRVNVNLNIAANSHSMWSESYDVGESELFNLHEQSIKSIVAALGVGVTDREQQLFVQPPTDDLEAYDYYLRAEQRRLSTREEAEWVVDIEQAMRLYREAIKLDSGFAEAYLGLAVIGLAVWAEYETDVMPGAVAKKLAYEQASKVKQLDPSNPGPHYVLASLQGMEGQHEIALRSSQLAIELSPSNADAWITRAEVLLYAGELDAALTAIDKAFALNPKPPEHFYGWRAHAYYLKGQYDEAILSMESVHWFKPTRLMILGQLGRLEEARAVRSNLSPFFNLGWYRASYAHYRRKQDRDHMIDGLRKAGMPENAYGFEGESQHRLDSAALKKLAVGRTWSGADSSNLPFIQDFAMDNRVAFKNEASLMVGTYRIDLDKLCVNFPSNILGRDDCGHVYRNPGGSRARENEYVWSATGAIYYFTAN